MSRGIVWMIKKDNEEGRAPLEYLPRGPRVSCYATARIASNCAKAIRSLIRRHSSGAESSLALIHVGLPLPRLPWVGIPLTGLYHKYHPAHQIVITISGARKIWGYLKRCQYTYIVNKDLSRMGITWEEAEVAAQNRSEWRQSVAECIHLDAGWIKVKAYIHCESKKCHRHRHELKQKILTRGVIVT